jgi:hypothetical protein
MIRPKLKWSRKVLIEKLGKPLSRGHLNRTSDQIQVGGAVDRMIGAGVTEHRKIQSIFVPVLPLLLVLHVVLIAGRRVVVVITSVPRGHRHDVLVRI